MVTHRDDLAPTVSFQGVAGAFGEAAVEALWPAGARLKPARTFHDALETVLRNDADWAVVPVWNSTVGRIDAVWAELERRAHVLARHRVVDVAVRHCMMALPGASIADIAYVGSHPAALAQCRTFLAGLRRAIPCDAFNTAGAAQELAELAMPKSRHELESDPRPWYSRLPIESPYQLAVIAGARAAEQYGLVILQRDVQDDPSNVTRFAAVRRIERPAC